MQQDSAKNSAQAILQSPEGRQLAALMAQSDGETLRAALEAAKRGDGASAQELLRPLLADERVQALLRRLEARK